MNTIASRFLSFEETLGAGLVKFAYYVLLGVLIVWALVAMIGGIVAMFTVNFWTGLGQFLLTPVLFIVYLILLRVASEVVLAILSIDDRLSDGALLDNRYAGRIDEPAPSTMAASRASAAASADVGSVSAPAPSGATNVTTSPAKPATKKRTRKSTKTATKKANAKSAETTKSADTPTQKMAEAAKAATRPSAQDDAADDGDKN